MIHNSTANQAIQDTLRSNTRIQRELGKLARNTRTVRRITSNEISMGMASLNTAALTVPASVNLAV